MMTLQTTNELRHFFRLASFDNRFNEEIARYICFHGNYIFRRDSYRLAAYKTEVSFPGTYHYSFQALERLENAHTFSIEPDGTLWIVSLLEEEFRFPPQPVGFQTHSLSILESRSYTAEFHMDSSLLKQLANIQKMFYSASQDINYGTVTLDLHAKQMILPELQESVSFPCTVAAISGDHMPSFSFSILKDFLINSYRITDRVKGYSFSPYYTLFQLNNHILCGVTHKRIL